MRQGAFKVGLTTVIAVGLLAMSHAVPAARAQLADVPVPSADPFYAPPANLASYKPGAILRSRAVTAQRVSHASAAYQLLYRTTDAKGQPIATVTTVFTPSDPAPGPRILFSLHPAEDSLTTKCAPSYVLRTGQVSGVGDVSVAGDTDAFLQLGWDVAVPDYEGPDSQWAVGPLEGYTTLDGIRAAEGFDSAQLQGARTKVAMGGYSGGSIPTLWAASLAPSYAPELNIVAAAAGGNLPDPYQNLAPLNGSPFFGTVVGVAVGVNRAYPELDLDAILNAKGRALAARDGADADGCGGSVTNAPFGTVAEYSNYPTPEALLALPRVRRVFAQLNLIGRPAPAAPSFIFNSAQDELTIPKPVDQLVAAWCGQGATIEYQTPPGDHLTGSGLFGRMALPYIQDRLAGKPAPNVCPPKAGKRTTASGPTISRLRVSPRKFSAAGRRVHGRCVKATGKNRRGKPCRRSIKLKATYTLNVASPVNFKLTRKTTGRKVGGTCVKATRKNRRQPKCRRAVSVHKTITRLGVAGSNTSRLTAKLAAGTYKLTATPVGGTSSTVTLKATGRRTKGEA